jgi:hypothetical protein
MLAIRAHLEKRHGGEGPVIRDVLDDGEARTAVRAIGKWVMEAAVALCKNIFKAGFAGGYIGRDELVLARLSHAVPYLEPLVAGRRVKTDRYPLYPCQRRGFLLQFGNKKVEDFAIALNFDLYVLRSVAYPSFEMVFTRQAVYEGPETYSLYHAPGADTGKFNLIRVFYGHA